MRQFNLTRIFLVIFIDPPEAPYDISHMFFGNKLYVFGLIPYNEHVRKILSIEYAIRFMCKKEFQQTLWRGSVNCDTGDKRVDRRSISNVTCVVDRLKEIFGMCRDYQVVLIVTNKYGRAKSKTFFINRGKDFYLMT